MQSRTSAAAVPGSCDCLANEPSYLSPTVETPGWQCWQSLQGHNLQVSTLSFLDCWLSFDTI